MGVKKQSGKKSGGLTEKQILQLKAKKEKLEKDLSSIEGRVEKAKELLKTLAEQKSAKSKDLKEIQKKIK